MDTSKPYEIRPASEGGFCVLVPFDISNGSRGQVQELLIAAFSNAADMIGWLATQHGVSIAFNVERSLTHEEVYSATTKPPIGRLVPRQVAEPSELAMPDGPMMPWDGKYFPEAGKGLPCIVRLRNGDMCSIHTGEDDGCRWEWDGKRSTDPRDVVGYWLA